jgi:uncharacterized protein (TIGR02996 family)
VFEFLKKLFGSKPTPPPPVAQPFVRAEPVRVPGVLPLSLREVSIWHGRRGTRLPPAAVVYLGVQLCALLSSATKRLIALNHHDVRFTDDGAVFIAAPHPFGRDINDGASRGSVWHMSPEQLQGREVDERSDVFNVATVLAELLHGGRLFVGDSEFQTIERILHAHVPPRPDFLSAGLDAVMRCALRVDPAARTQRLAELRTELLPFLDGFDTEQWVDVLKEVPGVNPPALVPTPALVVGEDATSRLVFADSLEENGRLDEASWLRVELRVRETKGVELEQALTELRALSERVGSAFMATVSRAAVEGCPVRFGFKCPMTWDAMARTAKDDVRHCTGCRQDVQFCTTLEQAQGVAGQGGCVALAPNVVRTENDLDPTPAPGTYVGRLA